MRGHVPEIKDLDIMQVTYRRAQRKEYMAVRHYFCHMSNVN
jgi:hypothetical protein